MEAVQAARGENAAQALRPIATPLAGLEALVLVLEVLDRFAGIHVEDGFADRVPLAAVEEEDGRRVAEIADRGEAFHVAALDSLETDAGPDQGCQLAGVARAGKADVRL